MPTSRRAFTDEENNDEAIPCAILEGEAGSAGPIPHPACVNFCCMQWSIPSNKTETLISIEVVLKGTKITSYYQLGLLFIMQRRKKCENKFSSAYALIMCFQGPFCQRLNS